MPSHEDQDCESVQRELSAEKESQHVVFKYKPLDQSNNGFFKWLDERPGPPSPRISDDGSNMDGDEVQHAILVRMVRVTIEGMDHWRPLEFEIRSPHITAMLVEILGFKARRGVIVLPARCQPLFHKLAEIRAYMSKHKALSDEAEEHFEAFQKAVLADMKEDEDALCASKQSGIISFENLWVIFPPGDLVLWHEYGSQQLMKLTQIQLRSRQDNRGKDEKHWEVAGVQVDWNGMYVGYVQKTVRVYEYAGTESVEDLAAMPLSSHSSSKRVYENITRRGAKFASLRGCHVKAYSGSGYIQEQHGEDEVPISGRVIIDTFAYYRCQDQVRPPFQRLLDETLDSTRGDTNGFVEHNHEAMQDDDDEDMSDDDHGSQALQDDDEYDSDNSEGAVEEEVDGNIRNSLAEAVRVLKDEDLAICTSRIQGFALDSKRWMKFDVDGIRVSQWNKEPFQKLVLSSVEKELLLAFSEQNVRSALRSDEAVKGKGRGMIVLLSGSPGVGKTLTAESLAETIEAPLYNVSASDLGTNPGGAERQLRDAFLRCRCWNALLLVDEADVFLTTRDINSLERNELVSVFLRLTEGYEGLMFLTTNRPDTIDPAFESRIDLILEYPDLDHAARYAVWKNFLDNIPEKLMKLTDEDVHELAKTESNGREIKSAVKLGQILAQRRNESLDIKILQMVLGLKQQGRNKKRKGN